MGRLGWSPDQFWNATPHDWHAAFSGTPEQFRVWAEREQARELHAWMEEQP
jgi:hypothetical protein